MQLHCIALPGLARSLPWAVLPAVSLHTCQIARVIHIAAGLAAGAGLQNWWWCSGGVVVVVGLLLLWLLTFFARLDRGRGCRYVSQPGSPGSDNVSKPSLGHRHCHRHCHTATATPHPPCRHHHTATAALACPSCLPYRPPAFKFTSCRGWAQDSSGEANQAKLSESDILRVGDDSPDIVRPASKGWRRARSVRRNPHRRRRFTTRPRHPVG